MFLINFLKTMYRKMYRFEKTRILTRVACLGSQIIEDYGIESGCYINHQKSRIDFLLSFQDKIMYPEKSTIIYKHLFNKYIFCCIDDQKHNFFKYKKPDLIVIDSYSELTDQLFINKKNNKVFLANYSDLIQDDHFKEKYHCKGLLNLNDFESYYHDFFKRIDLIYKGVPVIFIHFSTVLDHRIKFKERDHKIQSVIKKLTHSYDFLHSIELNDNLVHKSKNINDPQKDFPYHYAVETYNEFQNKFNEILRNINFNV